MPLSLAFRRSFYASLALAMFCLAFANRYFLGDLPSVFFLLAFLGVLLVAYRLEGCWSLRPEQANRVGLVLTLVVLSWLFFKLPRSQEDVIAMGVPWPAGFLPLLGPVLPLLLLAKLFRPKTIADFWPFQIISLMTVTLACVLTGEAWFMIPLILYVASLLVTLTLFQARRAGSVSDGSNSASLTLPAPLFAANDSGPSISPWRLGRRVPIWTIQITLLGLVLFFAAPRYSSQQWVPERLTSNPRLIMTGNTDQAMDLNNSGQIQLSSEPAFEVTARDSGGQPMSLSPGQRWRSQVLERYDQGRWKTWMSYSQTASDLEYEPLGARPVAGEFGTLQFRLKLQQAGMLVLADPPRPELQPGREVRLFEEPYSKPLFEYYPEVDIVRSTVYMRRQSFEYRQLLPGDGGSETRPAKGLHPEYLKTLLEQPIDEIEGFTRELLLDLPNLSDEELSRDEKNRISPEHREKVASAIATYFNSSGQFTYTLKLRRKDTWLDPLADFLLNIREGHCERYAGGLALVLRSLGIPARIVRGYYGVEALEDGQHVVRQSNAHSWVEALVPGSEPGTEQWLTLDATPSQELVSRSFAGWLSWLWNNFKYRDYVWRAYFMELDIDAQREAARSLWNGLSATRRQRNFWQSVGDVVSVLIPLIGVYFIGRKFWIRRYRGPKAGEREASTFPFYDRFVALMARRFSLQPAPGQTPREFAQASENLLQPAQRALPEDLVNDLYRHRFGGHPVVADWGLRLDNFEKALSSPASATV